PCLGSAREVALSWFLGSYWFPRDIYELTLDSRPASPGTIDPSRNRSPPIELCFGDLPYGPIDRDRTILPRLQGGDCSIDSLPNTQRRRTHWDPAPLLSAPSPGAPHA